MQELDMEKRRRTNRRKKDVSDMEEDEKNRKQWNG